MIFKIFSILLVINSILITVDVYKGYGWQDSFVTATIFAYFYIIVMMLYGLAEQVRLLIGLNKVNEFLPKTIKDDKENE